MRLPETQSHRETRPNDKKQTLTVPTSNKIAGTTLQYVPLKASK